MSANDAYAADFAKLLTTFGETVTRWPLGDSGSATTLTAIVALGEETGAGQLGGGSAVRDDTGERIVRTARLEVALDQAIDDRDVFVLGTERWQVLRITGRDAGSQTVLLERVEPIRSGARTRAM